MRIENWVIVSENSPYTPPEQIRRMVKGEVFGHHRFPDGARVHTSCIQKVDGTQVTTRSGSVYTLGTPAAYYVDWCRRNGCHVPTPEEPIRNFV